MSRKKKKIAHQNRIDRNSLLFYKNIVIIFLLGVLILSVSLFKAIKIKKNDHFNPTRPGSLFYSETAFHYRHAQIIAEAKANPFGILRNDKFIQHPETINVLKYYTIMMEFAYSFAYKIFNFGLPFNLFLIYFNCLFSSLPVVMVFLIAKYLFRDDFIGLGACLFYISTPASFIRMLTAPFLREDFALFFLLLSVWLILILLDTRKRPALSIFTGLMVVLCLSSWHFSQFVYICMLPFFCWIAIKRPQLLDNFPSPFFIMLIAGFIVPVLKTRIFSTSLLMCGLYTIFIGYFLAKFCKKPSIRALLILGAFIGIMSTRNVLGLYEPAYSHVFGLFFEKLRFLLQKPDNPLLLSFNARQLWEGAFNSPTLTDLWRWGKLTFPLGIIGTMWLLWTERRKLSPKALIAALTLALFILSMMVRRILMVSAPFASVALWGCLTNKKSKKHIGRAVLVFLLSLNFIGVDLEPKYAARFIPSSFNELCEWINSHTSPTDAIVARIPVGPMILLNTGRPEVLHPKFENLTIRKKYEEFIAALYGADEEELFRFCRKNKAEYFVYDWAFFIPDNKDSVRYLAGNVPAISEKTVVCLLHFCSPELKHFRPLYRNNSFIVFKVIERKEDSPGWELPYSPIYDPALFIKERGFYQRTREIYDDLIIPYAHTVNKAVDLLRDKQASLVIDVLKPMVQRIPRGSNAVYLLAMAFSELKQYQEAQSALDEHLNLMSIKELAVEPFGSQILELKADILYFRGLYNESFKALEECLKLPYHSAEVYRKLGILSRASNNLEEANRYFQQYRKYQQRRK